MVHSFVTSYVTQGFGFLDHLNLSLQELSEQHELEKAELLSEIEILEKELSCLSLNALAKEKESLRKDLEKTKVKLKETESKLKNAIQEKTKLEVLCILDS